MLRFGWFENQEREEDVVLLMVPEESAETTCNAGELRRKTDQRHGEEQLKTEKLISGSNFGRRWRRLYCTVLGE
jgi:hypothetical protein